MSAMKQNFTVTTFTTTFCFLLALYARRVHSQGFLEQRLGFEHHQESQGGTTFTKDRGERHHARGLKQRAAPASAPQPRIAVPVESPLPALNSSDLGNGFRRANSSDRQCGTPIMKPSLTLAVNMFFEFLHEALPDNATLKARDTANLTAWRSILNDPTALANIWPDTISIGKDYFNLTLPVLPAKLKLPTVSSELNRRRLLQTSDLLYTIPVYFIIIEANQYLVDDSNIQGQVAKLNSDFAGTGLAFTLAGVQYLLAVNWFNEPVDSQYDAYYKGVYRQGGPEALNVFVRKPDSGDPTRTLYGRSYFPYDLCGDQGVYNSDKLRYDGITLLYETLPGMSSQFTGAILTHETGHWLGLPHTFNQPPDGMDPTCNNYYGDGFSDTPVELMANNQSPGYATDPCNTAADSCPQPGYDPVQNHMDYSPDTCANYFTPQQIQRMQWSYYIFRLQKQCSIPTSAVASNAGAGAPAQAPESAPSGGSPSSKASAMQLCLTSLLTLGLVLSL